MTNTNECYFESDAYKQKENYFLEKIKNSTSYFDFIRIFFEDLEEEAKGEVDIFMLGIEAFNLESEEIEQKDLLDLLINLDSIETFCLLSRYGLSVTAIYHPTAEGGEIFYIVNGVNGYEILRKKKT